MIRSCSISAAKNDGSPLFSDIRGFYHKFIQLAPPHMGQTVDRAKARMKQLTGGN